MRTSLATLAGLKRSLTVKLPIETFKQKTDKILQKIATQVTIDGFRKGKVPVSILRQQFGDRANSDAVNELVNETLSDALAEVKATPASRPVIVTADSKDDNDFSYIVEFEVYPVIKVADFSKLKIQQATVTIDEADEEKTLEGLIEQSTEYKPVERNSQMGDQVSVDFQGSIDGEAFQGSEAKDFKLVLGKGSMIKGFEQGLIGAKSGQSLSLDLTFPKDYHAKQLAAKAVNFAIVVNEVCTPEAPKLDANFAKKFGEKDMDALQQNMKKQMRVEADNRIANQNKEAVFDALLMANDFEVPQESIDHEAQNLSQDMQARMQQQGMPENNKLSASTFNAEAKRRVQLGLLIAQIADDNKLSASKAQVDEKLVQMSKDYGKDAQQMIDYYNQDPARLSSIELLVVEKMVQDVVLEKAKVSTISKKFKEVTQQIPT